MVGASQREGSVGWAIFRNLVLNGYLGTLFPINPKYENVMGVRCYPTLSSVDMDIDLAVIAISAPFVPELLLECAAKGVKGAIVISAGFKEVGGAGVALETQIRDIAQASGIALLGPNCLGIINTDPMVSMNASFARRMAIPGSLAFMSQSGALCTSILDYAAGNHIGFSKFISFGNKADVTETDLLGYLAQDKQTKAILMYLEDLTDGALFMQVAREITENTGKPILAIKTGRTPEGASAAASHTGSLAGTDEVYDAVMAQAGVLRVDTVQELFDYAMAFGNQPLPQSNRVAIVTNAGGPGIMTTDACMRYGLKLAEFSTQVQENLKQILPSAASVKNPVDVIGDARHDRYASALDLVLTDSQVDGVIVILTPQTMTDIEDVAEVIVQASVSSNKPILASFMGLVDVSAGVEILRKHGVPHYPFPEGAARVLGAMHKYQSWVSRPRTSERIFDVDRSKVQRIFEKVIAEGRNALPEVEAMAVLEAYGFPTLKTQLAKTVDDAVHIAQDIGFPVVMKIASPDILHKTDVGGVVVGVEDVAGVREVFETLMGRAKSHRPDANLWGVAIQQMAKKGREVILGMTRDHTFGPLIMFGLGGIYTEALRDVTFRLAPLRCLSARNMLSEIRGRRILEGIRGEGPVDLDSLQTCLERLSQLVVEFPLIKELDINPLMTYEDGACVSDARIILDQDRS
ncbi:MAG: acetyl coenzyme A synthetase (ADP forming)-like protein [Candidatus Latescibacterota bacterium]